MKTFKECFEQYPNRTDKVKTMNYTVYEELLKNVRNKPLYILEIGTGLAGSARAFSEYYPNSIVYTIEIDKSKVDRHKREIKNDRIHFISMDSTDTSPNNQHRIKRILDLLRLKHYGD